MADRVYASGRGIYSLRAAATLRFAAVGEIVVSSRQSPGGRSLVDPDCTSADFWLPATVQTSLFPCRRDVRRSRRAKADQAVVARLVSRRRSRMWLGPQRARSRNQEAQEPEFQRSHSSKCSCTKASSRKCGYDLHTRSISSIWPGERSSCGSRHQRPSSRPWRRRIS